MLCLSIVMGGTPFQTAAREGTARKITDKVLQKSLESPSAFTDQFGVSAVTADNWFDLIQAYQAYLESDASFRNEVDRLFAQKKLPSFHDLAVQAVNYLNSLDSQTRRSWKPTVDSIRKADVSIPEVKTDDSSAGSENQTAEPVQKNPESSQQTSAEKESAADTSGSGSAETVSDADLSASNQNPDSDAENREQETSEDAVTVGDEVEDPSDNAVEVIESETVPENGSDQESQKDTSAPAQKETAEENTEQKSESDQKTSEIQTTAPGALGGSIVQSGRPGSENSDDHESADDTDIMTQPVIDMEVSTEDEDSSEEAVRVPSEEILPETPADTGNMTPVENGGGIFETFMPQTPAGNTANSLVPTEGITVSSYKDTKPTIFDTSTLNAPSLTAGAYSVSYNYSVLHGTDRLISVKGLGSFNLLPDFTNAKAWREAQSGYNTPGLWGQCTWFAWGRFYELYGFDPGFTGNGYQCVSQLLAAHPDKFEMSKTPAAGAVFSSDIFHNHVGIVLDYDPESGMMTIQEGNLDVVSNPQWEEAIADYRTVEVTPAALRQMYGNVTYAVPKAGVKMTDSPAAITLRELALNRLKKAFSEID